MYATFKVTDPHPLGFSDENSSKHFGLSLTTPDKQGEDQNEISAMRQIMLLSC